jgi:hypothetical protein
VVVMGLLMCWLSGCCCGGYGAALCLVSGCCCGCHRAAVVLVERLVVFCFSAAALMIVTLLLGRLFCCVGCAATAALVRLLLL